MQNGYHVPHFQASRGKTKVGIIYPTLFNLVVDNVVHKWLFVTVEDELVAHDGLGLVVGRCMGMFYMDDGMVESREPDCIQGSFNVLISLF